MLKKWGYFQHYCTELLWVGSECLKSLCPWSPTLPQPAVWTSLAKTDRTLPFRLCYGVKSRFERELEHTECSMHAFSMHFSSSSGSKDTRCADKAECRTPPALCPALPMQIYQKDTNKNLNAHKNLGCHQSSTTRVRLRQPLRTSWGLPVWTVSKSSGASCLRATFNWNAEILAAAKTTASGFTTVCTVRALTADEPSSIKTELKAFPLNPFDYKRRHTHAGWETVTYTGHERTLPSLAARISCMIPVRKKGCKGNSEGGFCGVLQNVLFPCMGRMHQGKLPNIDLLIQVSIWRCHCGPEDQKMTKDLIRKDGH